MKTSPVIRLEQLVNDFDWNIGLPDDLRSKLRSIIGELKSDYVRLPKTGDEAVDDDVFMTVGAHYLCNRCEGCPFYDIAQTCDSVPLNCKWLVLHHYFSQPE